MQAVHAGADALGLMFYPPSRRFLSIESARQVNAVSAPFVSQVAVVVNPDKDFLDQIIANLRLDYIQCHGEESAEYCRSFNLPYIKALRVAESTELLALERRYPDADAILLDSHVVDAYGGTGKTFEWHRARYGGTKPVILAGGLTAENVESAISLAKPYGVDVSSGVETHGVKDKEKIKRFCANVASCRTTRTPFGHQEIR